MPPSKLGDLCELLLQRIDLCQGVGFQLAPLFELVARTSQRAVAARTALTVRQITSELAVNFVDGDRRLYATLYFLLLIVPLLGWAAASARGWRVTLFPGLALPALLPRGSKSGFLAGDVHSFLAYTLLAIVGLHIAAALYHRLVLHDGVLARMLPGRAIDGRNSRQR